ncbi:hypothetical protein EDC96DRAFT_590319 [Choanephora cucurbitarum]|nr:hypothetical protein EDC96DRAFT_590319 [Choanephora cucurbitarum]
MHFLSLSLCVLLQNNTNRASDGLINKSFPLHTGVNTTLSFEPDQLFANGFKCCSHLHPKMILTQTYQYSQAKQIVVDYGVAIHNVNESIKSLEEQDPSPLFLFQKILKEQGHTGLTLSFLLVNRNFVSIRLPTMIKTAPGIDENVCCTKTIQKYHNLFNSICH